MATTTDAPRPRLSAPSGWRARLRSATSCRRCRPRRPARASRHSRPFMSPTPSPYRRRRETERRDQTPLHQRPQRSQRPAPPRSMPGQKDQVRGRISSSLTKRQARSSRSWSGTGLPFPSPIETRYGGRRVDGPTSRSRGLTSTAPTQELRFGLCSIGAHTVVSVDRPAHEVVRIVRFGPVVGEPVRIRRRERLSREKIVPVMARQPRYAPDLVLVSSRDADPSGAGDFLGAILHHWIPSAAAVPADDTKRAVPERVPMRSICSSDVSMKQASSRRRLDGGMGIESLDPQHAPPAHERTMGQTRRFPIRSRADVRVLLSRIGRLQEERRAGGRGCGPHTHPALGTEGTGCGPPSSPSRSVVVGFCGPEGRALVRVNRSSEPPVQR